MSTRHLTDAEIERYRERTLPSEELFAAVDHMFACDICHRRLVGEDPVDSAYRFIRGELHAAALEHSDHLRFEQIVAFATGQLDEADHEILESHVEECPDCDAEVADARLLRASLHLIPPRGPAPTSQPKRKWLPSGWQMLYQIPAQIAAMVLIAFLAGRFATTSLRSRTDALATQVSHLRIANDNLASQLAARAQPGTPVSVPSAAQPEQQTTGGPPPPTKANDPAAPPPVTLRDGGRTLRLASGGGLESGGLIPAKYVRLVASALGSGRLPIPSASLPSVGSQTRSGAENDPLHLLAPLGVVTISDRPTFRWEPVKDARSYSVMVRDAASDEQVESNAMSKAVWIPENPLERGHTYSWVVVVTLSDGRRLYVPGAGAGAAMFRVLDKSTCDELQTARTKSNGSHLLMAVLYARYGLTSDARNELNALEPDNRGSSVLTRLQRNLESSLRR